MSLVKLSNKHSILLTKLEIRFGLWTLSASVVTHVSVKDCLRNNSNFWTQLAWKRAKIPNVLFFLPIAVSAVILSELQHVITEFCVTISRAYIRTKVIFFFFNILADGYLNFTFFWYNSSWITELDYFLMMRKIFPRWFHQCIKKNRCRSQDALIL